MDDNLRLVLIVLCVLSAVLTSADLARLDHCLSFDPGVKGTDPL